MKRLNDKHRNLRRAIALLLIAVCLTLPAFAAENDALTTINNLSDFIFQIIKVVGLISLGFGMTQVGLSLKSHDPSQRTQGIMAIAGGILIYFSKEVIDLITGG